MRKLSFNEKRKIELEGILKSLYDYECECNHYVNVKRIIHQLSKVQDISSQKLEDIIKLKYGEPTNPNDLEYLFCEILTLYHLILKSRLFDHYSQSCYDLAFKLLENIKVKIVKCFPEYKVEDFDSITFIKYKPREYKTIVENLKDIPEKKANPIIKILKPMLSENDLIAYISKIYQDFEKRKPESLQNLNKIDQKIYQKVYQLAKMIVNNVKNAKGHKGESELTVKDIAHNFALNASLLQKLINLNDKK